MNSTGGVCVFSERREVALELLSVARHLAGDHEPVVSIVAEPDGDALAREQIEHGADGVFLIESPGGADPDEAQVCALDRALGQRSPEVLLVGATAHGTEIAARLAQRREIGCASECTRLDRRDDKLLVERICLGRFVARQVIRTRPAIATVQPRRFEPTTADEGRRGRIDRLEVEAPAIRTPILQTRPRERSRVRIDKANIVVGVGRGLKNKENLRMIAELAGALGGVVGASRPLTDDLQWLPSDRKVGLSGVTIQPRLYIACGISGQIEHNVGMRDAGVVVAINSDPTAPIMRQADYCVTGDLHEIVPALTKAIRRIERG